jgi:hypothetical protein
VRCGEVVATVDYDIGIGYPCFQPFSGKALANRFDDDLRIDPCQCGLSGDGLQLTDALLRVQNLALQIGQVNRVAIGQRDAANAGRSEIERSGRTQSAGTDDQCMRTDDPGLAFDTYFVKQDVSAVAEKLLVSHRAEPKKGLKVKTNGLRGSHLVRLLFFLVELGVLCGLVVKLLLLTRLAITCIRAIPAACRRGRRAGGVPRRGCRPRAATS